MKALIVGIDPGLTGAFAALRSDGEFVAVEDLPVIRDRKLAWIDADAFVSRLIAVRAAEYGVPPIHAMIERVHAMPRNGSLAAFSQGCTFGSILAALQLVQARIEFVPPQTWKRAAGLIGNEQTDIERKRASLDKARLKFPQAELNRQKDHGRAESLLIADWAVSQSSLRRTA